MSYLLPHVDGLETLDKDFLNICSYMIGDYYEI